MESSSPDVKRLKRQVKPIKRYIEEYDYVAYALKVTSEVQGGNDPDSYRLVMTSMDASKCLGAMRQEMESLEKNNTWSIVKAPKNKRVMTYGIQMGLQEEGRII